MIGIGKIVYFAFKRILCNQNLQQFHLESISKGFSCWFWSLVSVFCLVFVVWFCLGFCYFVSVFCLGFVGCWVVCFVCLFGLLFFVSLFILLLFMFVCFLVVCSEFVLLPHQSNNLWVKTLQ